MCYGRRTLKGSPTWPSKTENFGRQNLPRQPLLAPFHSTTEYGFSLGKTILYATKSGVVLGSGHLTPDAKCFIFRKFRCLGTCWSPKSSPLDAQVRLHSGRGLGPPQQHRMSFFLLKNHNLCCPGPPRPLAKWSPTWTSKNKILAATTSPGSHSWLCFTAPQNAVFP